MKKETITTIIGIAMILGLALTATPLWAAYRGGLEIGSDCWCQWSGTCPCKELLNRPLPQCDYLTLLNAIRSLTAYAGEDDDYIYINASVIDGVWTPDPNGSVYMVYDKAISQSWINNGCQGEF